MSLDIFNAKPYLACAGRGPLGHVVLRLEYLPTVPEAKIHHTEVGYVVPDAVRRTLEASRLTGVAFKPVVITDREYGSGGPYRTWKEAGVDPWWELTSDRWMVQLAPTNDLRFVGNDQPLSEQDRRVQNYGRGIYVREGRYLRPELRYTRQHVVDILRAGWDLARTPELIGQWVESDRRYLVASQRFYQFCRHHDLGGEWVPVRIE